MWIIGLQPVRGCKICHNVTWGSILRIWKAPRVASHIPMGRDAGDKTPENGAASITPRAMMKNGNGPHEYCGAGTYQKIRERKVMMS